MPRGDRTGPVGEGPMTGRGAGFCASFGPPGFANPGVRGGRAFGMGRRKGFRHMYHATGLPGWARFGYSPGWAGQAPMPFPPTYQSKEPVQQQAPLQYSPGYDVEQEKEILNNQAQYLKKHLEEINKRLQELEEENLDKDEQ